MAFGSSGTGSPCKVFLIPTERNQRPWTMKMSGPDTLRWALACPSVFVPHPGAPSHTRLQLGGSAARSAEPGHLGEDFYMAETGTGSVRTDSRFVWNGAKPSGSNTTAQRSAPNYDHWFLQLSNRLPSNRSNMGRNANHLPPVAKTSSPNHFVSPTNVWQPPNSSFTGRIESSLIS